MQDRVIGIGGVFFKANDPDALRAWYRDHLGMDVQDWGGVMFVDGGPASWSIFDAKTKYFAPSAAPFMINYRVKDLRALLATLRAEGCDVDDKMQDESYGRFGWVMDPEGNRIELWEPIDVPAPP